MCKPSPVAPSRSPSTDGEQSIPPVCDDGSDPHILQPERDVAPPCGTSGPYQMAGGVAGRELLSPSGADVELDDRQIQASSPPDSKREGEGLELARVHAKGPSTKGGKPGSLREAGGARFLQYYFRRTRKELGRT